MNVSVVLVALTMAAQVGEPNVPGPQAHTPYSVPAAAPRPVPAYAAYQQTSCTAQVGCAAPAGHCNVCDVGDAACGAAACPCNSGCQCNEGCQCNGDCQCDGCQCSNGCHGCPAPWQCRRCARRYRRMCGGGCNCNGCGACGRGCCCGSTCDMFPHYAYMPVNYGYYYFRPYNWSYIGKHQSIVAAWGMDPVNPYSRVLFENLYADRPRAQIVAPTVVSEQRLPILESLLDPAP